MEELKELVVVGLEEAVQSAHNPVLDGGMFAPLASPQTPLCGGVDTHAVETPRAVEIEQAVVDAML